MRSIVRIGRTTIAKVASLLLLAGVAAAGVASSQTSRGSNVRRSTLEYHHSRRPMLRSGGRKVGETCR